MWLLLTTLLKITPFFTITLGVLCVHCSGATSSSCRERAELRFSSDRSRRTLILSPAEQKTLSRRDGNASLLNEGVQHARLELQIDQCHDEVVPQLVRVPRRQVAPAAVFRPAPHPLIGVQRRGVPREVFRHHLRMLRQPRLDRRR